MSTRLRNPAGTTFRRKIERADIDALIRKKDSVWRAGSAEKTIVGNIRQQLLGTGSIFGSKLRKINFIMKQGHSDFSFPMYSALAGACTYIITTITIENNM